MNFMTNDSTKTDNFIDHCTYTHKDEYFQMQLVSINLQSSPDADIFVNYQVSTQLGKNNENEILLCKNLKSIKNFTFEERINFIKDDDYNLSQKVRITQAMRLLMYILYVEQEIPLTS